MPRRISRLYLCEPTKRANANFASTERSAFSLPAAPDALIMSSQVSSPDSSYGALLIGGAIGLAMYGVTVHNMYIYLRSPAEARDPLLLRLYIIVIFVLDTFSTILIMHTSYTLLVTTHPDLGGPEVNIWSLEALPFASELVFLLVQGFYARRVYLFDKSCKIVVLLVAATIVAGAAMSIAVIVIILHPPNTSQVGSEFTVYYPAIIGLSTGGDLVLTATFVVLLYRSRSSFKRSVKLVNALIHYALVGTLLFGVGSIVPLVLILVLPNYHTLFLGVSLPSMKVYFASVLVFLNHRDVLREHGMGMGETTIFNMSVFQQSHGMSAPLPGASQQPVPSTSNAGNSAQ
ncbi:hypothetical protein C8Q76DRAFT_699903 [Earliella scabrosa]|nr:hypothetical protein C8Q76DRAFT_699903 [Earliella scabrosa]